MEHERAAMAVSTTNMSNFTTVLFTAYKYSNGGKFGCNAYAAAGFEILHQSCV